MIVQFIGLHPNPITSGERLLVSLLSAENCEIDLQTEDVIDCDRCLAKAGRLFSGYLNREIRKCALQRNIGNCVLCSDYSCEKLQEHFLHHSLSQTRLEEI